MENLVEVVIKKFKKKLSASGVPKGRLLEQLERFTESESLRESEANYHNAVRIVRALEQQGEKVPEHFYQLLRVERKPPTLHETNGAYWQ